MPNEQKWLIDGALPQGKLAVLYGDVSSGKSFVALGIACAIASGRPWHGRPVKKAAALYICAEGQAGLRRRIDAYMAGNGVAMKDLNHLRLMPDAPNFTDPGHVKDLIAGIQRAGRGEACVLVVDAYSSAIGGGDPDARDTAAKVLASCEQIHRATGALVVLVHYAGDSGLHDAADCEIEVTRRGKDRTLKITQLKNDGPCIEFDFRFKVVEVGFDEDDDPITSCVVDLSSTGSKTIGVTGKKLGHPFCMQ